MLLSQWSALCGTAPRARNHNCSTVSRGSDAYPVLTRIILLSCGEVSDPRPDKHRRMMVGPRWSTLRGTAPRVRNHNCNTVSRGSDAYPVLTRIYYYHMRGSIRSAPRQTPTNDGRPQTVNLRGTAPRVRNRNLNTVSPGSDTYPRF